MNRRHFLIGSGGLGLAALAGLGATYWFREPGHEFYSSYGDWTPMKMGELSPPLKSHVVFFSPSDFKARSYEIPFRMHSGVQDPQDRTRIVLISKWGREICSLNRVTGKVIKMQTCAANRRLFGHGVWDEASGGVWITENDDNGKQGYLVLRNRDLEIVREIPSGGFYPHEVKMSEPGVLQVANTGNFKDLKGNLSWLSTQDGRVVKRLEFSERGIGPSHFLKVEGGETVIGSITEKDSDPSCVWRMTNDLHTRRILPDEKDEALFRGEVVSLAEHKGSKHLVLWTQAHTAAVFGCELVDEAFAEVALSLSPRGMIADGNSILVTKKTGIVRWPYGRKRTVAHGPAFAGEKWGSHIVRAEV